MTWMVHLSVRLYENASSTNNREIHHGRLYFVLHYFILHSIFYFYIFFLSFRLESYYNRFVLKYSFNLCHDLTIYVIYQLTNFPYQIPYDIQSANRVFFERIEENYTYKIRIVIYYTYRNNSC